MTKKITFVNVKKRKNKRRQFQILNQDEQIACHKRHNWSIAVELPIFFILSLYKQITN